MILSDRTLREHLEYPNLTETITVDPEPTEEQIQPASLDVRLGEQFVYPDTGDHFERDPLILRKGDRVLAHTRETIDLPNDIAAQLAGRSTYARKGIIVHKTAGWIDPGFEGQITLELYNMSEGSIVLDVGDRVAQLVFLELSSPSSGYDGRYQGQQGATEAR